MAEQVFSGRFTAEVEGDFVVFLIGARVNTFKGLRRFGWIGQSMNKMMDILNTNPQKGYLGGESFFRLWPLTVCTVTYWRSFEDLDAFAFRRDDPHVDPARRFNQEIGADGSMGIWHETYLVRAGEYEVIYGNMPLFGLAKATRHVPVGRHTNTARQRLRRAKAEVAVE